MGPHGGHLRRSPRTASVSRYLYGIEFPPKDFRLALVEAAGGRVGTSFDRLLLTCYRYDPATRKYQPYAFGIVRAGRLPDPGRPGPSSARLIWRERSRARSRRRAEAEADGMNELLRTVLFLPDQASDYARDVDHLHFFVILTTMVAAVGVFGDRALLLDPLPAPRRTPQTTRRQRRATGTRRSSSPCRWPSSCSGSPSASRSSSTSHSPPKGAMDVYVQGKKWMWKFAYPGGPNSLDVLRVPAGRPVRLLITSRDVIHSFFVPALRLKQDALPGRYTADLVPGRAAGPLPGLLRRVLRPLALRHAGRAGGDAGGRVRRLARRRSGAAWPGAQDSSPVAARAGAAPAPACCRRGARVAADQGCLKCHSVDGSRHIGPTWVDLYGRAARSSPTGENVIADEAYLTRSMMDPGAELVAGYQNVMPTYQGKLPPPEAAAVVEYIKSLRTSAVTPGTVGAARL